MSARRNDVVDYEALLPRLKQQLRLATLGDPVTTRELQGALGIHGGAQCGWLSQRLHRLCETGEVVRLRLGTFARGPNWSDT